jgi:cysteinyl-tRNA synthetase
MWSVTVPAKKMLRIHDTAAGALVELKPREPGKVSMYVCGPTVYGVPHLGHGRFSLVFDIARRYLEWCGYDVNYVSNITDIDDNIIRRANEENRSTDEVVAEYEAMWWDAMDGIGVKRPTHDPHATAYVERMVELVSDLQQRGIAYVLADGVYFSTEAVGDYGLLAGQPLDSLRAGARVDVTEGKRSPTDFVLWKLAKPGEPSWPSPWGEGRPGWHTECVVMSLDLLGDGFDIHGGGQDLRFPHHENERAQAVAIGRDFARHWMHNGFVEVGGEKMSKSLGNFTTLTDLLAQHDPRAYRLLVLQAHYRSPIEVTGDTVERAERSLATLDNFARRVAAVERAASDADAAVLEQFRVCMDDDLDTPGAMAILFDLVRRTNAALDQREAEIHHLVAAFDEITRAVGLELEVVVEGPDAEAAELARQRDEARSARDYAKADALRDELVAKGWVVEDSPAGTKIHRRA